MKLQSHNVGIKQPNAKKLEHHHTIPCVIMCNQMSPTITNGCLCDYFSNFDGFWFCLQLIAIMTYFIFPIGWLFMMSLYFLQHRLYLITKYLPTYPLTYYVLHPTYLPIMYVPTYLIIRYLLTYILCTYLPTYLLGTYIHIYLYTH